VTFSRIYKLNKLNKYSKLHFVWIFFLSLHHGNHRALLLVMLILVVKERMKGRELHKYFSVCPTVIDG